MRSKLQGGIEGAGLCWRSSGIWGGRGRRWVGGTCCARRFHAAGLGRRPHELNSTSGGGEGGIGQRRRADSATCGHGRGLSKAARPFKPPRPGLRASEMRATGWPITCDSNPHVDLLWFRRLLSPQPLARTGLPCFVATEYRLIRLRFHALARALETWICCWPDLVTKIRALPLAARLLRARGR